MVGAMLATVLFKFTQPLRAVMTVGFEVIVRIAVDVGIGMSACRALLPMWRSVQPLALMGTLAFRDFGFSPAARAVRMDWLDAATALLGFTPGGIRAMSLGSPKRAARPWSWPPCIRADGYDLARRPLDRAFVAPPQGRGLSRPRAVIQGCA